MFLQHAAALAILLTTTPVAPASMSGPWVDHYGNAAKATVSADRRTITVCDQNPTDGLRFKVDYATDNPVDPTIYTVTAPEGDCKSDRTYISWIMVFKLCSGYAGPGFISWRDCNPPIRTPR
ncbi:hypothetical protein ABGB17_17380 [Sphaerisporangium sp. B11E5]|uniref:hypothetical protein n=1 Tax=Sphaerisporangium sp. B11E5 TaxID=3153563 RepID=UPI00325E58BD